MQVTGRPSADANCTGEQAVHVVDKRPFQNEGNTCYINTVLQLLATNAHVTECAKRHICQATQPCIFCALSADVGQIFAERRIPPLTRKRAMFDCLQGEVTWRGKGQQDATEFFNSVFMLAEEHRPNDESFASALASSFGFIRASKRTCTQCGMRSMDARGEHAQTICDTRMEGR